MREKNFKLCEREKKFKLCGGRGLSCGFAILITLILLFVVECRRTRTYKCYLNNRQSSLECLDFDLVHVGLVKSLQLFVFMP